MVTALRHFYKLPTPVYEELRSITAVKTPDGLKVRRQSSRIDAATLEFLHGVALERHGDETAAAIGEFLNDSKVNWKSGSITVPFLNAQMWRSLIAEPQQTKFNIHCAPGRSRAN